MSKLYSLTILTLIIMVNTNAVCQKRGNLWCFGDSSGISFNNISNPIPIQTGMDTRGSSCSISDSAGTLLFYAGSPHSTSFISGLVKTGGVYDSSHQLMQNGDTIVGRAWYNEYIIIPDVNNDSLFYLITAGVTSIYGLYYSIIDLSQNGGLGAVIQKNIQLQSFAIDDGINAIKHGNGRDWWVFFRKSGVFPGNVNNQFYSYLISPSGISNVVVQNIGSLNTVNSGKITFSPNGDRIVFHNRAGLIELFDFDRCTGLLSNVITIHPQDVNPPPYNLFWGCEFSPNGNILYVTISDQTSYLFQFDLTAPDIWASIDTLWVTSFPGEAIGGLKRGPDGKIYQSGPYTSPSFYNYPYPDSVYNMYNMNLGVINYPDSLGAACNFQPYSFYLGGKRTYWGLPNNPDYDLGPLVGSPCDTLVGINEAAATAATATMFVYYTSGWQTAFINAQHLTGNRYSLEVYDIMGKSVFRESGKLNPPYFTKNLNCSSFATGVYTVVLITERERLVKRFVRE